MVNNFFSNCKWGAWVLSTIFFLGLVSMVQAQSFTGLPATMCVSDGSVSLSGSPSGTFSGPGISGSTFNPATAGPGTHTITFTPPRYRIESIGFSSVSGTGTTVTLADDNSSGAINLGFSFNFFDNNYTQTFIGSNGFLSFGSGSGSRIQQTLPSTADPDNLIAMAWTDLDPGNGTRGIGANFVWFTTAGTAPNRTFTVNFWRVDQFVSGNLVTGKIILRESSNFIDIHITSKPNDGSNATEGIENSNGTQGFAVAGRNNSIWTATNSSHRWIPQLPVNQTVTVLGHNTSISCPSNITVNNSPNQCSAPVSYSAPNVNDDCQAQQDDFDPGINNAMWSSISLGTAATSCGSVSGNALFFNGTGVRQAITNNFNTTDGGTIAFSMLIGTAGAPCENADAGEGVVLEYSNNSGGTWVQIASYNENSFPTMTAVTQTIPAAARTASTRFRWRQLSNSGANFDNWSIDNVRISVTPTASQSAGLSSGSTFPVGTTTNTFTYTDAANTTVNCSFNVTVNDNQAPNAICQNRTVNLNASGNGSVSAALINNGSTDNCAVTSTSVSPSSFNCNNLGTNTVTLTVGDAAGNTDNCTATVTVNDNIAPNAICRNRTVSLNASGSGSVTAALINNNSTDNCGVTSLSVSPSNFSCSNLGANTVTLTVGDASGNTDNCTATVTVVDNIAPNAICQNRTVQLSAAGNASITAGQINNGSTDNCAVSSTSVTPSSFNCNNLGANAVTLTVNDASGNSDNCSATVTVQDNIAPNALCRNVTVALNGSGSATVNASQVNNGSSDNCSIGSLSVNPNIFDCGDIGTNTVTLTVSDGSGNISTCNGVVTVQDNTGPNAICQNTTVQLNAAGNGIVTAGQVNNGSTDNCSVSSTSVSPASFNCGNLGNNTVTLTVNDGSGNSSTCTGVVTVQDAIAPTANCRNLTVNVNGSGAVGITASQVNNGSTDNCSVANLSVSPSNFTCSNLGNNSVALTVTDGSGNQSTCNGIVTVRDITPPSVTCQNFTANIGTNLTATVSIADLTSSLTDNCSVSPVSVSPNTFNCGDRGNTIPVTVVVQDPSGNTNSCISQVTITDPANNCNLPPNAVCQNITVNANGSCQGTAAATAFDGGSTDPDSDPLTFSVSPTGPYPLGTSGVTLTVSDPFGATDQCTATITVVDNTAPNAVCRNVTVQLNAAGNASVTASQINDGSTDNCGIASIAVTPSSFDCSDIGANTVTLTVTDNAGNSSNCTATVTVGDNIAPNAVCGNATVQLNASGSGSLSASAINTGSTDNCSIASVTVSPNSFNCGNVGSNSVTLTVTDGSGNSSNCTGTVTVEDNIAPVAACQNLTVQLNASGSGSITAASVNNGSSDACGIANLSLNNTLFTCSNVGSGNNVTLTVTDNNSNSDTCSAQITVEDNIAPTALCQNITVQLNASGTATISASDINNGSSDACGISTTALNNTAFDCNNVGNNNVTLTVTDVNTNSSTCAAIVTVEDNVDPVALCQNITVQLDASGNASIVSSDIDNGSNDACGISGLSVTPNAFTCSNVGNNTVTLTATDNNGNSSTCTGVVTVEDNVAPNAICRDLTLQLDGSGNATTTAAAVNNNSSDACGIASLSIDNSTFNCTNFNVTNTVTLTVTDFNGNVSTCTSNITIDDPIAPVANCQDITVQLDQNGAVTVNPQLVDNGSTDNCAVTNFILDNANYGCANVNGTNNVVLTVFDAANNTDTCNAVITVEDNIAPNAVCQDLTVQIGATGTAVINAGLVDGGSNDACGIASLALTGGNYTCSDIGSTSETLTVTDVNGNVSSCVAQITIEDNISPTALCQDITVQLDAGGNAIITSNDIDNGSSDNCGLGSLVLSQDQFNCNNVGTTSVVLIVNDVNGNSGICFANVTIEDNLAPNALCQDVTVSLNASGNGSITTTDVNNGSNDNCAIANLSLDNTSFDCNDINTTNTVTLTVTDVNGNTSNCSSNLTVVDNVAPVAVCQNVTVQLDANGAGSTTAAAINNGSSDACGIASLSLDNSNFACADVGFNTVTLTVTDVNGNASTCSGNVTVQDNVAPNAVCQNITVQLNGSGNASITTADVNNGSSDACGIAGLVLDNTTFNCASVAVNNTVTLTVTDVNGNVSTCTSTVSIEDTVPPAALCQDLTIQLDANGAGSITTASVNNGSSDNCAIANLSLDNSSFGCADVGSGNTVTLTVTDVNNNQSSCTAAITVEDNIAPIALCQDVTVQLDANGAGSITTTDVDNGSNDACGIASLSLDNTNFACGNIGINNTVILTVTDNNGNASNCSANVTVEDNVAPNAICQDITVQLDPTGNATITPADINNGSTDACGIASLSLDNTTFNCANIAGNTVTLTVTDVHGNSSTCTANVSIEDNVAPIALCQDVTVQLDANGNGGITTTDVDNGSSDNCSIASLSLDNTSFDCNNVGSNTVTLTVTDVNGNASTCTSIVTVEDNIAPIALCQDVTVQLDANGAGSTNTTAVDNGSNDACGIANLTLDVTNFGCNNVGANTVTLTATDVNGNSSTCTGIVTVEDNVDPVALCQDVTVQLNANGAGSITTTGVNNGSNDACGIASLSLDNTSFDCNNVNTTNTVTLTVTDVNNNASTCTAQITVEDNVAPVALCQDVTVQLDANGAGSTSAADVNNGSSDACGIATLSLSTTSYNCTSVGTNSVILVVTDNNGNQNTCSAVVTVEDNVDPVALCQDVTVQLDANGAGSITTNDVDNGSNDACGIASLSLDNTSFDCNNVGNGNTVTLTVTDVNSNSSTCTATITVEDNIAPVAICQDVTIQLDANGSATTTAQNVDNGSNDACGIASLSLSQTTYDCSEVGPNLEILTVTDVNGNSSTCSTLVEVQDNIDPVAICQDVTIFLDNNGNATTTASDVDNGSNDNCSIGGITLSQTSFNCSEVGGNPEVLTVVDASGNVTTCTTNVTVVDTVPPAALCQDLTVQLDPTGNATITAQDVDAGSNDNCAVATISLDNTVFNCANVAGNTVTLTVTDVNGNQSSCTATITIEDSVPPIAICQDLTIQLDAQGAASITPADVDNGSNDNCAIANLSLDNNSFACSNVGTNTVTLTVDDVNGNSTTCTSQVTVEDNVAPIALCQDVTVQLNASGAGSTTANAVDNGSNDACGIASLSLDISSFDCNNVGANTVTLTATDNNGNATTCTAIATVEDNISPIALCQDVTVQLDANGSGSTTPGAVDNGSSDACGIASLSLSNTSFACSNVGTNPVVLVLTDVNGNQNTCSAIVTVEDNVAPVALCQDVTVQLDANGTGSITTGDVDNGSNDACGIASLSLDNTSFDCNTVGNGNTVTLTVTDVNSNSSTCTATITVEDNIAPIALCQDLTVQLDVNGAGSITAAGVDNGSNDACGIASLSLDNTNFACADVGANTVTLTATDVNNNASTCTAQITVEDNVAPVAICQDITVQLDPTGNATITPQDIDNGSNDACGIASLVLDNTTFNCANVAGNTVTLTVTDNNGNISTCTANVSIEDSVAPIALCQDVTVQLDANGAGSITTADVDNGSNDNCAIANLALDNTNFDCNNVGNGNTVTLTVTDVNNNQSSCTATVTVEDNIAPIAVCQDLTIQLDPSGAASITANDVDNGSNDACGIAGLSLDNTSFSCSDVGANTVTLTATDVNGNTGTCTSQVTVEDTVPPIAICQDVTVQLDPNGNGSTAASAVDNGSNDNCSVANLSLSQTSFDCSEVGANTEILTVTDVNGNTSTCTTTVTVQDNISPQAVCQNVTVYLDVTGNGATTAQDVGGNSNDACGIGSLILSNTDFDCNDVGGNSVILIVNDVNGNNSACFATVFVEDTVPAVALCQDVTVQLDANGQGSTTAQDVDNGSNDACGVVSLSLSQTDFDCSEVGPNPEVLTVTDVNGNVSTCTATITVEDNIDPIALCQDVTVQLDVNGAGSITAADIDNGSNDACGIASLSVTPNTFACSNVGGNTVTLTATDVNGNSSTCTANVQVEDNVAPVALCQDVTVQLDANGAGSITTGDVDNGSNDACGIASLSLDNTNFACADVGANTVTLTVTDNNSNVSTCTSIITVEDNVAPIAVCQDITVQLDGTGNATITPQDIDNGSNDACGIASLSLDNTVFNCNNVAGNQVTLTVTDVNGNQSTCTANVTIEDTVSPIAVCQDLTIQLDAQGAASITPQDVDNGSTDNCAIASLSLDITSFACSDVGSNNTVTLTVTDVNGNSSTCTSIITVEDNVAPIALCQDVTVQLDANGAGSITTGDVDNGSNDACGIASLSLDNSNFACADVGANTVTLTVTDNNGNQSTCTSTITVEDNIAPIALCQDLTVQLDAQGAGSITPQDVDNGSNDACGIASLSLDITSFGCSNVGSNPVVLTVTDVNNNSATCGANITVEDTVSPIALCQDVTVQLDANGAGSTTPQDVDNGSNDACGIASLVLDNTSFDCNNVGSGNTVTLTVTDVNNNQSSCTATVTVEDNIDPIALCQDITIQLDANGASSITAQDVDNGSNDACGIASLSVSPDNFDCANTGPNTVTLTVTDNNNNVSTCNAIVTVQDTIAPVIVCASDLTVSCNAEIPPVDVNSVTVTDNCPGAFPTHISDTDNGGLGCLSSPRTIDRLYQATDASGNTSTCNQLITVIDTIAPVITCPPAVTINCTDPTDPASTGLATATDNCIPGGGGSPAIMYQLADSLGNTDITYCGLFPCFFQDPWGEASLFGTGTTFSMNVSMDQFWYIESVAFKVGNSSADFTLDQNGLPVQDASWTVVNTQAPTANYSQPIVLPDTTCKVIAMRVFIIRQEVFTGLDATSRRSVYLYDSSFATSSNPTTSEYLQGWCPAGSPLPGGPDITFNDVSVPGCGNTQTITRTFTATDTCGNNTSCTQVITTQDVFPPVITCPADITVNNDLGICGAAVTFNPTAVDECGTTLVATNIPSGSIFQAGTTTVTAAANDECGNISICTFDVTVLDAEAPNAVCQDITVQLDPTGNATITAADVDGGSTDNCVIDTIFADPTTFNCANVAGNTVTLTVIDTAGNQSTCTANVTIEDNVPPIAVCQDITIQLDAQGAASIVPADVDGGSNDNCAVDSLSLDNDSFGCVDVGSNTVTLTVYDVNGNTSTCTANVEVEDNVAPIALCQDVTVQLDANGQGSTTPQDVDNGSNDACGIASLSLDNTNFDCNNVGSGNTVTLTATDVNGNSSTCTATVTVEDNIDPIALCQDVTVQLDANGAGSTTPQDVDNGSNDACGIATLSLDNSNFDCNNVGSGNTVTLTATDVNGNSSTCTSIVTVEDNVAPIALCQDVTVQLDANGAGSTTAQDVDNGSNDACGIATLSLDNSNFDCNNVGSGNTVTLTVTDVNGNTDTCTATVTVEDNVAPIALCQDVTVQLDANGAGSTTPQDVDNGSNDACGIATLSLDNSNFDCNTVGSGNTVTLTVTDVNGNASTCTATVTVEDNIDPIALCQDVTVQLDANGAGSTTAQDVDNGSNDACGIATLSLDNSNFDCNNVGSGNTVTLTATDVNGNSSTCTAIVTVEDNIDPIALCQDVTVQLDANGQGSTSAQDVDNGSNDACGIATLTLDNSNFDCNNVGSGNTVTLTATDVNGNSSTCTSIVTVEDNIAPNAICQDITVQLDSLGNVNITPQDIDNGSNDACGIASLSLDITTFDCNNVNGNTVTLTVTDVNGNASTCTAQVTVSDTVPPVTVCQDITVQLDAGGNVTIVAADVDGGSTSNCGVASLSIDVNSFDCSNVGPNTVTLTATDVNNNVSSCTAIVTVEDNVAPIALCQDVTVQLDANGAGSTTPQDVDNGSNDACGIATLSLDNSNFDCTNLGSGNTVTLTVTDNNSNQSTCTSTVTVEDTIAPIAVCQDVTVQLDAAGMAMITAADVDGGSTDNCTIDTIFVDNTMFTCSGVNGNTVILTVVDQSGNSSTCTANVTVIDSVSPIAICQDITIQLDANGQASITAQDVDGGSNDNCAVDTLTIDVSTFDCSTVGSGNTVTLTVTDVNGNVSTCTANVTVEDSVAPIALCQDVTVQLDVNGQGGITATDVDNGSNDACGIASLTLDNSDFDCSNVGSGNTVTLTVTDNNGNASTCTSTITVEDNIDPVAVCRDITVQLDANGQASIAPSDVDNGSNDACGIANLTVNPNTFDCQNVGPNSVTLTVTDVNGNTDSCAANVEVEDNIAPNALCQDITIQLDANGQASITAGDVDGGSNDACGIASLSVSPDTFNCSSVSNASNTVTLTVTDVNGNVSTCTSNITVEDNIAPTAICQSITVQLDSSGMASISGSDVDGGSFDNCAIDNLSVTPNQFDCQHVGDNPVVLTVTDENGNSSTCTANVNVQDTIAPTAVCMDVTISIDETGIATLSVVDVDGGSFDNCDVLSVVIDADTFTCENLHGNTVTLTITDVNGNVDSCIANVTVIDPVPPVAVCQDITVYLDGSGNVSITGSDIDGGSTDNCSIVSLDANPNSFACDDVGANPVVLTVTDQSGNDSTCTASVTVVDTVAPNAVCQDITVYLDQNGIVFVTAADIDGGSNDACGIASLSTNAFVYGCGNIGNNSATLTVTDVNGNVSTCSSNITVLDTLAPTFTCVNATIYLDGSGNGSINAQDLVTNLSDNCGSVICTCDSSQVLDVDCDDVGTFSQVVTVTDVNGNIGTCTTQITVIDSIPPVAVCQDITVQLDANGQAAIIATDIDGGSTDNCALVLNAAPTSFDCSNIGSNAVTLTVSDSSGNTDNCTANVTVEDNVDPIAVCQDITVQLDGSGNATITGADVDGGSSDACGIAGLSVTPASFDCSTLGSNIVTLTVTDVNGNTSTCTANVAVEDNIAPSAICRDITVQLDGSGNATITAADVDGGSTDNCAVSNLSVSQTSFDCSSIGSTNVTLTVTDQSGNSSTCTSNVTVEDNVAPTAVCQDLTVQIDVSGMIVVDASDIDGGSSDNCAFTISTTNNVFTCQDVLDGPRGLTLTVTDVNGNVSTCVSMVTVVDTTNSICCPLAFDFEEDAANNSLAAGTIVTNQYAALGVLISAENNNGPDVALIFDSGNPTGGDPDLGTPNQQYGGPGVGSGGSSNSIAEDNILIIAEDVVDNNNDGLVDDPDDEASGGRLLFDFTQRAVTIETVRLVDLDDGPWNIILELANGWVTTIPVPTSGNNSALTVPVFESNVRRMIVEMGGSGGVAGFAWCPNGDSLTVCNTPLDMDRDDNGGFLPAGTIVNGQFAISRNVLISATNNNGPDAAILFDTGDPTGGDVDLGTPSQIYDGPGQGNGGASNVIPENNILVIAENLNDNNNDGLVDNPDDESSGGTIRFDFNNYATVDSIIIIDNDENNSFIVVETMGGNNITIPIPNGGDNARIAIPIGETDVEAVTVTFEKSGGVADLYFCADGNPTPVNSRRPAVAGGSGAAGGLEVANSLEAFPNPFLEATQLRFSMGVNARVSLKIYDLRGVEVANLFEGVVTEGEIKEVEFRPENMARGFYIARLTSEDGTRIDKKLIFK